MLAFALLLALSQTPSAPENPVLRKAIRLYETVELERARRALVLLMDAPELSERDRIFAFMYLAASCHALDDTRCVDETLTALAEIAPGAKLPPERFGAKLRARQEAILAALGRAPTGDAYANENASTRAGPDGRRKDPGDAARVNRDGSTDDPRSGQIAGADENDVTSADAPRTNQSAAASGDATNGTAPDAWTMTSAGSDPLAVEASPSLQTPPTRRILGGVALGAAAIPLWFAGWNVLAGQKARSFREAASGDAAKASYDPYIQRTTLQSAAGFLAGAALIGTGVVLLATGGANPTAADAETPRDPNASIALAPGYAGVTFTGSFGR